MRAKEKVLSRMQRFKRVTPPRLVHTEEQASAESAVGPAENPSPPAQGKIRCRTVKRNNTANGEHSPGCDIRSSQVTWLMLKIQNVQCCSK